MVVITQSSGDNPSVVDIIKIRGRAFTGSFEEEKAALEQCQQHLQHPSHLYRQ